MAEAVVAYMAAFSVYSILRGAVRHRLLVDTSHAGSEQEQNSHLIAIGGGSIRLQKPGRRASAAPVRQVAQLCQINVDGSVPRRPARYPQAHGHSGPSFQSPVCRSLLARTTELGARPSGRSRRGAVYPRSARESEHGGSRQNEYRVAHGGFRTSEERTTLETRRAEVTVVFVARPAYRVGARSGVGAARVGVHGRTVAYARRARASGVEPPDAAIARGRRRPAPKRRLGRQSQSPIEEPRTETLVLQPSVPDARHAGVRDAPREQSDGGPVSARSQQGARRCAG